jgi:hypothetical protein
MGKSMLTEYSLEDLHERFERLVLQRSKTSLSEAHRRSIADKFANKSLQELNEMACQLDGVSRL